MRASKLYANLSHAWLNRHENIEYGPSERKRRKMTVNFIVLVVLIGSFLGIIFFNGKKVDQKYLGKCGGLDEPGTLLYRDQYYPEIDLCPLNFDVPSPLNNYRDRVCKSIEMTGVYPTILKCPDLGPDSY